MEGIDLSPNVQLGASVVVAVLLIIAAVGKYFRDWTRAEEKPEGDHHMLTLAITNASAIEKLAVSGEGIAQSLREIRGILDRRAEREIERHSDLMRALGARASETKPAGLRRRTSKRKPAKT